MSGGFFVHNPKEIQMTVVEEKIFTYIKAQIRECSLKSTNGLSQWLIIYQFLHDNLNAVIRDLVWEEVPTSVRGGGVSSVRWFCLERIPPRLPARVRPAVQQFLITARLLQRLLGGGEAGSAVRSFTPKVTARESKFSSFRRHSACSRRLLY